METSLMSSRRIETCEDNDKELIAVGEMAVNLLMRAALSMRRIVQSQLITLLMRAFL